MSHVSACEWNILTFIQKYKADNHCSPTLQEIAKGVGLHTSRVHRRLNGMEAAGLLTMRGKGQRRARTIVLIPQTVGIVL